MRRIARALASWGPRHRRQSARPVQTSSAWFDEDGAGDQVASRASTAPDQKLLSSWVRNGYAIAEQLVPHDTIDRMLADVDELFFADKPIAGIDFHGIRLAGESAAVITHRRLLAASVDERVAAQSDSWRVHALFQHSAAADEIRRHSELVRIASMILGVPCDAHYSINFRNGSTQRLHEDTAVFHLRVPTLIVGAWIACEDIVEGSGPLLFYPGSHRRELFSGFDRYPLANLRTASAATTSAYYEHLEAQAARYQRRTFLARKGDVLFWHRKLIHGGSPITDPATTRRSYVLHYIPTGVDVANQITGPTNW